MKRSTINHVESVANQLDIASNDAWALRLAAVRLHRWHERECGDGNGCIERDEETGKAYWYNANVGRRYPIRDMETGALKRIAAICSRYGLHFYVQTDPRGGTLYLSRDKLDETNYTRGTFLA